jgi:hypothetical protein
MREYDKQNVAQAFAAIRKFLPSCQWDAYATVIADERRQRESHLQKSSNEIDRSFWSLLEDFRRVGFVRLPIVLTPGAVAAIRDHLYLHPVYSGSHIYSSDYRARALEVAQLTFQMAGYRADTLLQAPGLLDICNDPRIVDFIEAYLGCVPTLYSINGWHSFPAAAPAMENVQYFHRDNDDWRFCVLFLYLSNVDSTGGPHQVIPGSHTLEGMVRLLEQARATGEDISPFDPTTSFTDFFGRNFSSNCERLFGSSAVSLTGVEGSLFLVNTIALHRGLVPSKTARLMTWARYGLGPNTNSMDLEQGPLARRLVNTSVTDTPRNRYINRLLFEFERGPR